MRREVASLPSTEGSLFRSEGRVKKEKKARSGKCNWQSAFVFRMSKHWNYLSRVLPTGGGGALKGWEGFLPYWFSWLYSTSASYKWCLRNRTAERLCVTNMTRLLPACFVLIFTYYCVLVLSKGEWSLAENFQILLSRFTL